MPMVFCPGGTIAARGGWLISTPKGNPMTNDQNRNQGQPTPGAQNQPKTGQQSGQQQRQGGQQGSDNEKNPNDKNVPKQDADKK